MPKLKSQLITVRNEAGQSFEHAFEMTVNDHGQFRARIASKLEEDAGFMICLRAAIAAKVREVFIEIESLPKYRQVMSRDLGAIRDVLVATAKAYISVASKTERVICYAHQVNVRFVEFPDGTIGISGNDVAGRADKDFSWVDDRVYMRGEHRELYSVGLWAQVYDRTTHTRGGTAVTNNEWVDVSDIEDGPLCRLNSFYGMDKKLDSKLSDGRSTVKHYGTQPLPYSEMPYTPEAADFFVRCLLAMCTLAREIRGHFASPTKLAEAIATNSPLLLTRNGA